MKKIFILSFLLAFSTVLMAQRSGSTTTLLPNETTKVLTMTAADSLPQATTKYWVFAINKPKAQYFAVAVAVDTIVHACNHTWVDVLGSLDGTKYVSTGATQVKYGGTADSTFQLVDVSTGVLWKYLKVQFVNKDYNAVGARVTGLSIKVGDK